jgi:hypothetical protein
MIKIKKYTASPPKSGLVWFDPDPAHLTRQSLLLSSLSSSDRLPDPRPQPARLGKGTAGAGDGVRQV